MLLIPSCVPSILLWSKCETVVVSTQVTWDVGLLVFQGEWTQAQVRLLTWTTPAAIEGVWPLMIRVATQIFSYQWSALSKPCITPKSSHWCPNDCFPSNLPAQEKQHSPSSSHHIVLCCNFYPGNVRLMGPPDWIIHLLNTLWSSWPEWIPSRWKWWITLSFFSKV